jgi:hypothetical protein
VTTTGIGLATDGYIESTGAGGGVASHPTIEIITTSPITRDDPIIFKVHDSLGLRVVFIYVNFGDGFWEVVHDGSGFSPTFSGPTNQRTSISDGYEFQILRDGGWPSTPVVRILPVNMQGNVPL